MLRHPWRSIVAGGPLPWVGMLAVATALVVGYRHVPDTYRSGQIGPLVGYARVVDGDTIDIAGRRIRLQGIDAPEAQQTCTRGRQPYSCGLVATQALADRMRGQMIRCDAGGNDRYRRILARCYADGGNTDINRWMVRQGLAVAYRSYSWRYLPDEALARAAGLGLWAGSFEMPWDYRAATHTAAMPMIQRPHW